MAEALPLHDLLRTVSWLVGKWRTENGKGIYPTIKDFRYGEEIEVLNFGQPNLQISFYSWNADTKKPMHREVGFLRVKPQSNRIALLLAANNGVTEVEEGEVGDQEFTVESHTVGRLTFGKPPEVKKIKRHFKRAGNKLEVVIYMETVNTAMTEHLRASYEKDVGIELKYQYIPW